MISEEYWDLTDNPQTELKREMLSKYLVALAYGLPFYLKVKVKKHYFRVTL